MKKSLIQLLVLAIVSISLNIHLETVSFLGFKSTQFRAHTLSEEQLMTVKELKEKERGTWIAKQYGGSRWKQLDDHCKAIWNDVKYFPIPQNSNSEKYYVTYQNSWLYERNYGGKRGHEGCDLMASVDKPGLFPVISATDGIVTSKGWLEKGGYRIGITAPSGGYFYYAHLDSYTDYEIGDSVKAGDILGFMGNSGYGPEGTTGMFATHLHFGIYIYPNGEEISINPYWVLRMIEEKKLFCSF